MTIALREGPPAARMSEMGDGQGRAFRRRGQPRRTVRPDGRYPYPSAAGGQQPSASADSDRTGGEATSASADIEAHVRRRFHARGSADMRRGGPPPTWDAEACVQVIRAYWIEHGRSSTMTAFVRAPRFVGLCLASRRPPLRRGWRPGAAHPSSSVDGAKGECSTGTRRDKRGRPPAETAAPSMPGEPRPGRKSCQHLNEASDLSGDESPPFREGGTVLVSSGVDRASRDATVEPHRFNRRLGVRRRPSRIPVREWATPPIVPWRPRRRRVGLRSVRSRARPGHRSEQMVRRYIRSGTIFEENATAGTQAYIRVSCPMCGSLSR